MPLTYRDAIEDRSEDPKFYAPPESEPEISERERKKFLREIRRAQTVSEKQLLAFSWATGRVLR
jgi:hypothetical protein